MKPIELEFEAFGSFSGHEVIDFAALEPRGLFVVSGDTGTGKTTIFDAMCWALYGKMPLKESHDVKSHHATAETRTFVRLAFECGGEHYVVTRNPEQLRPAARGSGFANEPANAHLQRITSGGTESVATGSTGTSSKCQELVGLDAEQFQRVILLPQGEFTKFLRASTPDRESLLGQLFGGRVFDDIVTYLKSDRDELRKQVGGVDADIKAQFDNAERHLNGVAEILGVEFADDVAELDRASIEPLIAMVEQPLVALEREVAQLKHVAAQAADQHQRATEAGQRFTQAATYSQRLAGLAETEDEVRARSIAAQGSADARPTTEAGKKLAGERAEAERATTALAERSDQLAADFRSIGADADISSASAITAELAKQVAVQEADSAALQRLAASRAALDEAMAAAGKVAGDIESTGAQRAAGVIRLELIDAELPEARSKAIDPVALRTSIEAAKARIGDRRSLDKAEGELLDATRHAATAANAHVRVMESFVLTQAPRLAEGLVPGESCPVCGAVEHPEPAINVEGQSVTFDQVESAGTEKDAANLVVSQIESRCEGLRSKLGVDVDVRAEELSERLTTLEHQFEAAAVAAGHVEELETEHVAVTESIATHDRTLAGLDEKSKQSDRQVVACTDALAEATTAAADLDADDVARIGEVLLQLTARSQGIHEVFKRVDMVASAVTTREQALREALGSSSFATLEDAQAALMSADDELECISAAQRHDKARSEAEGALSALVEQGVPESAPDLDVTKQAAGDADQRFNDRSAALISAQIERDHCSEAIMAHDDLIESSGESRDRLLSAELAVTVCEKGGPGAAMSLKRWVLTRELDRVTAAANGHLQPMTSSRYTLKRTETSADLRKAFGLDLEVIDATTGRGRSTNSLSGGEQFQASLALALGLADVVSHGGAGSGKSFGTLFVDEGFGSLDPRSLDDAIETLHQLRSTGRMVGAITHVETMKQQLHVGIEVIRRSDGSGSTLVVHP